MTRGLPRLLAPALTVGLLATPALAQDPCADVTRTDALVVWIVEGDPIDTSRVLRVELQDSLVVEARYSGIADRWQATLPRPLPPDSIVFRGIEDLSYRQGRPARIEPVGGRCVAQVVALYDVSVRVSVSVRAPTDPVARATEVTAAAVVAARTGQPDAPDRAREAADFMLNPDSVPDPADPRLADPAYELAGVLMAMGDPGRAEPLYRMAAMGRENPAYESQTRQRFGIEEADPRDVATLVSASRALAYVGLARALELQGRSDEGAQWLQRADSVRAAPTAGPEPGPDPVARFAGLTALAVSLANTNRTAETRQAAMAAQNFLVDPDAMVDPRDPRLADTEQDLGDVFLFLGDSVRAEQQYRNAVAGRQDPAYRDWTRERYGVAEDSGDLDTLLETSLVLSYIGLARSLERQGRAAEALEWRDRAETIQAASGLAVDTLPAYTVVEREDPWGRSVLELNGSVGILNDEPEYVIEDVDIIRRDAIGTLRVGYITNFRFFFEGHAANSLIRIRVTSDEPGLQRNLNSWFFGGDLGLNFIDKDDPQHRLQAYLALGAEAVYFNPDGLPRETDFSWIYGIGARYLLTPRVAMRTDIRMHQVRSALRKTLEDLAGLEAQDMYLLELSVGVSWLTWPGYPHRERDRRRREAEETPSPAGAPPGT